MWLELFSEITPQVNSTDTPNWFWSLKQKICFTNVQIYVYPIFVTNCSIIWRYVIFNYRTQLWNSVLMKLGISPDQGSVLRMWHWCIIKQLNIGRSPRCNGCQPSYRNIFSWSSMLVLCEPEMFQPPANSITACKVSITTNKTLETHNPGLWSTQCQHRTKTHSHSSDLNHWPGIWSVTLNLYPAPKRRGVALSTI